MYLDELKGLRKEVTIPGTQGPVVAQFALSNQSSSKTTKTSTPKHVNFLYAQNIPRPQVRFEDKIDNSNHTPWEPKITYKPNAQRPLGHGNGEDISEEMKEHLGSLGHGAQKMFPHPYNYEIQNIAYPEHVFETRSEQLYDPMENTAYTWVDSLDALKSMCAKLENSREIAVDTEHHSYRSYQGFVCLIQISTREEDFIVDALELRSHLYLLNESFTNPNIVKVLHGAQSDIVWLQRDFGVYIVDMFDTYDASCILEFPHRSLAYLLKYYCDVETDKKYQLADWRIRPLPKEMLKYARSDTHYLLYIYDRMRNELLQKGNEQHNLVHAVLSRSNTTALQVNVKPVYDAITGEGAGWKRDLIKLGGSLSEESRMVFKALHQWRDSIAREEDESTNYVLPNHMLMALSGRLPMDGPNVLGCCNPIPPLVRIYANEIAALIKRTSTDYRQNPDARRQELERERIAYENKQKRLEEVRLRGPTHIRFGNEDTMDTDDESGGDNLLGDIRKLWEESGEKLNAETVTPKKVDKQLKSAVVSAKSSPVNTLMTPSNNATRPIIVAAKVVSTLFGTTNNIDTKPTATDKELRERLVNVITEIQNSFTVSAEHIEAMLNPVSKEDDEEVVMEQAPKLTQEEIQATMAQQKDEMAQLQKQKNQVIVIREANKLASKEKRKAEDEVVVISSDDEDVNADLRKDTESPEPVTKKRKIAKSSPVNSAPKRITEDDVTPFDYSNATSSAIDMIHQLEREKKEDALWQKKKWDQKMKVDKDDKDEDDGEIAGLTDDDEVVVAKAAEEKRKEKKEKRKKSKVFDPYSQVNTAEVCCFVHFLIVCFVRAR